MPPGIAAAPWRIPLLQVVGLRLAPEREVERVALVRVHVDARARLARVRRLGVEARAVARERRGVEIHPIDGDVRMSRRDQALDELDHLGDVLGGLRHDVRLEDVELAAIDEELFRVALRDHERIDVLAPRADRHLVLASDVGVADEMAGVGDVHHLPHAVAEVFERPAHDIRRQIAVEIADVLVVVDGRAAVVDAELARDERLEVANRARGAVVHPDPWRCADGDEPLLTGPPSGGPRIGAGG